MGLVDIVVEELQENVSKLSRSLGNRGYNPSIDPYHCYSEDMPLSIILSSLPHYSVDYFKTFDKLKSALCISIAFTFSYLHFCKMYELECKMCAQEYDKLVRAPYASTLNLQVSDDKWLILLRSRSTSTERGIVWVQSVPSLVVLLYPYI